MGGLLHTVQSHGTNKPALILHFKKTKIQTLLYSPIGFYKHASSLCVKFIRKKFILLSLSFHACGQPLLLQFLTFPWGGETCIMIYTLLGCFPIRNKEGAKQVRKLRDWPLRHKTTHMRQCLFSVWHKFSSCSVLSTLANQKSTRFKRYKADQQCQLWENGPVLSRRASCPWNSTATASASAHKPHYLHLQIFSSLLSTEICTSLQTIIYSANTSVCINCCMTNFPCI